MRHVLKLLALAASLAACAGPPAPNYTMGDAPVPETPPSWAARHPHTVAVLASGLPIIAAAFASALFRGK